MSDEINKVSRLELLSLASEIVSAYVSENEINPDDIPNVIETVYQKLADLSVKDVSTVAGRPDPAVPIKKSIQPDYLICLEDGKKLKMLKRHLQARYNMSPDEYRERWGLPSDYPMVAPNYAKRRSALAKDIGLGKR